MTDKKKTSGFDGFLIEIVIDFTGVAVVAKSNGKSRPAGGRVIESAGPRC